MGRSRMGMVNTFHVLAIGIVCMVSLGYCSTDHLTIGECMPVVQEWGRISSLSVTPYPPTLPGNITVSASVHLFRPVTGNIRVALDIRRKLGFWGTLSLPCLGNFGTCNYTDVCSMLRGKSDTSTQGPTVTVPATSTAPSTTPGDNPATQGLLSTTTTTTATKTSDHPDISASSPDSTTPSTTPGDNPATQGLLSTTTTTTATTTSDHPDSSASSPDSTTYNPATQDLFSTTTTTTTTATKTSDHPDISASSPDSTTYNPVSVSIPDSATETPVSDPVSVSDNPVSDPTVSATPADNPGAPGSGLLGRRGVESGVDPGTAHLGPGDVVPQANPDHTRVTSGQLSTGSDHQRLEVSSHLPSTDVTGASTPTDADTTVSTVEISSTSAPTSSTASTTSTTITTSAAPTGQPATTLSVGTMSGDSDECPAVLADNNIPCVCPFSAGVYTLPPTTFHVPDLGALGALAEGDYQIKVRFFDGDTDEMLMCQMGDITISDGSAPCTGFACLFG